MTWEIFAYGSGDILAYIFNAIAMIFGDNSYADAIKTCTLLGFLTVLTKAAFSKDILSNFKFFIGIICFVYVALVPKVDIIINDSIQPGTGTRVVQNVPIGLAATASFSSKMGSYLTKTFETVFSVPSSAQYSTTGLLFPQKLYEASRKMAFDKRTQTNLSEFFSTCVVIDGLGHNRFKWQDVVESEDLVSFFSTRVAENAARFKYVSSAGATTIEPCRSGFNTKLKQDMNAQTDSVIRYGMGADMINRFGGTTEAFNKVKANIAGTANYLSGGSLTAQSFVNQQALINAMATGTHELSQQTGAKEYNDFIISGAELERLTSYQVLGQIASEKLPLLRIIFEAVLYAVFPIIILLAVLSPVQVSKAYLIALVWINLWAPTYAILHFIMTFYTEKTMTDLAVLYGGGYSIFANTEMMRFNNDIVATTGFLATSLPMLTYMLVSKSGAMMAGFAGRAIQGYDKSVDAGAKDMVDGDATRLGVDYKTVQGENGSTATQSSFTNMNGSDVTTTGNGGQMINQHTSSLVVGSSVTDELVSGRQTAVDNATALQQTTASILSDANSSLLQESASVMNQLNSMRGGSENYKSAETVQQQENFQQLEASVEKWAEDNGVVLSDSQKAAIYAGVEGKIVAEVGTPLKGIFGSGASASVTTKAGGTIEGNVSETENDSFKYVNDFTKSSQYSDVVSHIGQGTAELAMTKSANEADISTTGLQGALTDQQTARNDHTVALSNTETARESLQEAQMIKSALQVDGGQALVNTMLSLPEMKNMQMVDETIRNAALGNQDAMNTIKQAIITSDLNQNFGASQGSLDKLQESLNMKGQSVVGAQSSANAQKIAQSGNSNIHNVAGQSKVDSNDVTIMEGNAGNSYLRSVTEPSSGANGAFDSDRAGMHDNNVIEKVEKVLVLEDTFPGMASTFNAGKDSTLNEELKERNSVKRGYIE